MKKFNYKGEKVIILKELDIKDKLGTWVQIEIVSGEEKGNRMPITREELEENGVNKNKTRSS